MTITVQIKNVYGTETVYPVCSRAKAFAILAGTRTLTRSAIEQIKALGVTIIVQPQVL